MRSLANSKDPDDNAAFHRCLRYNDFLRKAIQYLEVIICYPSIDTMDQPTFSG